MAVIQETLFMDSDTESHIIFMYREILFLLSIKKRTFAKVKTILRSWITKKKKQLAGCGQFPTPVQPELP